MAAADILTTVRPDTVVVTCHGHRITLTPVTARQWIGAIGFNADTLSGVLPGAVADDAVELLWSHINDDDAQQRWCNAARVAVGRASGRDWWWAVNLIRKSLAAWPYINGRLLLSNVAADRMTLPDWLDACYMMLWSGCDEKNRMKLDLELSMPPAGVAMRQSGRQKRKMLADFAAD